jgi:hypothetical protein
MELEKDGKSWIGYIEGWQLLEWLRDSFLLQDLASCI